MGSRSCNHPCLWLWAVANVAILFIVASISDAQQPVPTSCLPGAEGGSGADCGEFSSCTSGRCLCETNYFTPSGTHTDCQSSNTADSRCEAYSQECIYCGRNFEGPCRKCVNVIMNGMCLDACPAGTELEVVHMQNISLVIRTCRGAAPFVLPGWAIGIIAVLIGAVLFVMAVLITSITCSFLRQSTVGQLDIADRNNASQQSAAATRPPTRQTTNPLTQSQQLQEEPDNANTAVDEYFEGQYNPDFADDTLDEEEFLQNLAVLRGYAEVFLKMLNDMRRRLKEIPQSTLQAQQYRNVMQDLTRLLYLLNKNPAKIQVPPDGAQLLTWSQSILERYLQTQGQTLNTSPQQSPTRLSVIGDQIETNF